MARGSCLWEARHTLLAATALCLLLSAALPGCESMEGSQLAQDGPVHAAGNPGLRAARELAMNDRWRNRPLSELVTALGTPRLIMTIPGGGNPPGFAAVYGVDPVTGCIDAFAMLHGTDPTVRVYHCR